MIQYLVFTSLFLFEHHLTFGATHDTILHMEEFNETKINTNLRHAENIPNFWDEWKGTADRALANLTDDIYAYEANNNAYGKGIAIKYGDMNFWYSPENKMLVNSANTKITSNELRSSGNEIIAEQVNRLIELALAARSE